MSPLSFPSFRACGAMAQSGAKLSAWGRLLTQCTAGRRGKEESADLIHMTTQIVDRNPPPVPPDVAVTVTRAAKPITA